VALTIAALATLLTLTPRLPLQNVLAIGVALYLTSAMALSLGTRWGFLLGKFQFTDALEPRLLGLVPWPVPFLWVALVLASRQAAKVMLRPWRREKAYGWVLFGVSTLLMLLQAAVLDPFGHRVTRWWVWTDTPPALNWAGAPLTLFSDCAALTVVLLLVATAWLIPKRPTGSIPSLEPVVIWLAFLLCFALGNLRAGIWLPGAVGVTSLGLVGWLAWRGRQFSFSPAGASADAPA
jgi:putative membrane protein